MVATWKSGSTRAGESTRWWIGIWWDLVELRGGWASGYWWVEDRCQKAMLKRGDDMCLFINNLYIIWRSGFG